MWWNAAQSNIETSKLMFLRDVFKSNSVYHYIFSYTYHPFMDILLLEETCKTIATANWTYKKT